MINQREWINKAILIFEKLNNSNCQTSTHIALVLSTKQPRAFKNS